MPVPTNLADLSTTAASNFPQGSDTPSVLDDVQRAHASFIAQIRDGSHVTAAASKTTPVDADTIPINDSAASNILKKLTWANLKATLKTWIEATQFSTFSTTGNVGVGVTPTSRNNTTLQIKDGIGFPATQVASADANTLDDYEEGTFTPTIVGTTVAGAGTYSIQYGSYTKIGNRVEYDIYIVWSAHTGTGNMQVGGLPFTSSATTNAQRAVAIRNSDVTLTASNTMVARLGSNTVAILIEQAPVGGGSITSVVMDGSGSLHLNGSYTV